MGHTSEPREEKAKIWKNFPHVLYGRPLSGEGEGGVQGGG